MTPTSRKLLAAFIALGTGLLAAGSGQAESVADFYSGRTIKVVVPGSAGGTRALYVNVLSRHMPRHVPGNPTMALQLLPGTLKSSNYLYNVAPKDGTTLALMAQGAPNRQVERPTGVQYDATKFQTIGLVSGLNGVWVVSDKAPARSIDGFKKNEIIVGSIGTSNYTYTVPRALAKLMGLNIKIISGYKGSTDSNLALERGETHAGLNSWLSIKKRHPDWAQGKGARIILQIGLDREPELPDVPTLVDIAENDRQKRIFAFMSASNAMARGIVAPPGVPADRIAALRDAFDKTTRDRAFLAEMKKRGAPVNPKGWKAFAGMIETVVTTPKDIVEETRKATAAN